MCFASMVLAELGLFFALIVWSLIDGVDIIVATSAIIPIEWSIPLRYVPGMTIVSLLVSVLLFLLNRAWPGCHFLLFDISVGHGLEIGSFSFLPLHLTQVFLHMELEFIHGSGNCSLHFS